MHSRVCLNSSGACYDVGCYSMRHAMNFGKIWWLSLSIRSLEIVRSPTMASLVWPIWRRSASNSTVIDRGMCWTSWLLAIFYCWWTRFLIVAIRLLPVSISINYSCSCRLLHCFSFSFRFWKQSLQTGNRNYDPNHCWGINKRWQL